MPTLNDRVEEGFIPEQEVVHPEGVCLWDVGGEREEQRSVIRGWAWQGRKVSRREDQIKGCIGEDSIQLG
jgi:hypothetical protein